MIPVLHDCTVDMTRMVRYPNPTPQCGHPTHPSPPNIDTGLPPIWLSTRRIVRHCVEDKERVLHYFGFKLLTRQACYPAGTRVSGLWKPTLNTGNLELKKNASL
jgi:hypothetical protein